MFDQEDVVTTTLTGIKIRQGREDRPKFERIYNVRVSDAIVMKVTCKSYIYRRSYMGELTQSNGRYVLFEPDRPADKILDREILPEVERRCHEIIALDRAYVATNPSEFKDERGVKWVRV